VTEYLIDTQSLLWFVENDEKLPLKIKSVMEDDNSCLITSIASLWEIAIKTSIKKLVLSVEFDVFIEKILLNGFEILPIEYSHLITLTTLEFPHRDPFDRIIIAQAIAEKMQIISSDDIFGRYPVKWFWV
jgi:PIN domain nuclease of toxin-antitoxin system